MTRKPQRRVRRKQLVYFSMVANDDESYDRAVGQLMQSVASLRRHNRRIPVKLVVTGRSLAAKDRAKAAALSVEVVTTRSYEQEIRDYLPRRWAKEMALFPLIQKWLNLRYVIDEDFDQLLYVDNDTYFMRDVGELMARSASADVYAREEPYSSKSWLGRDPGYLDEAALLAMTRAEKVRYVTPFNCGVVLLRRPAATWLTDHLDLFLAYLRRFTVWMCRHPNTSDHPHAVELPYVLAARKAGLHLASSSKPLPFLGRNRWIVEERALWLTLGHTPFSVKCFSRGRVQQGGEFEALRLRRERPYLVHYFGANTEAFARWRARMGV